MNELSQYLVDEFIRDVESREKHFLKSHPDYNENIFNFTSPKLDNLNERLHIPKRVIEYWVETRFNDVIHEITTSSSGPVRSSDKNVDDGPNFFFRDFDTFDNVSKKRAEDIGYEVFRQIMSGEFSDYTEYPEYPSGPVKAVTPFPAGVIGQVTATNQKDFYGDEAYDKWYRHVTRSMGLTGYTLVSDIDDMIKHLSTQDLPDLKKLKDPVNKNKKIEENGITMGYPSKEQLKQKEKEVSDLGKKLSSGDDEYYTQVDEDITIPINVGDTVLGGKFKNKKIVVKDIGKNEKGDITINGKPLMKYRLTKEEIDDVISEGIPDIILHAIASFVAILIATSAKVILQYLLDVIFSLISSYSDMVKGIVSPDDFTKFTSNLSKSKKFNTKFIKILASHGGMKQANMTRFLNEVTTSQEYLDILRYHYVKPYQQEHATTVFRRMMIDVFKNKGQYLINTLRKKYPEETKDVQIESILTEIPMSDLIHIDKFADSELNPVDVVLTGRHFMDRLVDPRNRKPISFAELLGFFKRLSRHKDKFVDFLKKYGEVVVKDNRTKINIPFMKQANKAIAKTIMRKDNFLTPSAELKFENTSGNDWSIFRINSGKKWFATRYNKANKQPDEYRADVRHSSPEVLKFNHDRAIKIIQSVIGISEKYGIVNSNGIQKVFDWRVRYPKKYEDVYNLINEDMIPGGLSDGMDISGIASHHSVDVSVIEKELEKGMKVELEHTSDEKIAKEIAIDHLYEDPKYYTKLSTIEENTVKYLQKSLGVSREKMPQISSSDVHNYVEYLRKHGVNVKGSSIPISKIGMTQKDINTEKVKALLGTEVHNLSKPVIISKDNYILDGHHRVVALYNIDNNFKLKTIKVNLPIQKLLDITHGYPKVSYKTIHEYGRVDNRHKAPSKTATVPRLDDPEEKTNLSEINTGIFRGKIKIGGEPVEVEVELYGADNKTKQFLTKIIHIDPKYRSRFPIGSTLPIPSRIFRMPGGGWVRVKTKGQFEIQEGSDIGTLGGGNNSARWTPPGKSKKLGIEQLSGYIQKDFPVADSMDISGEKDHWMSSSVNAKFHNKVRAKRDISGNLVLEGIGDKLEAKYGVEADVYEYGDYIELSKVVVPKDKRGSGIGTKFMDDLIKYAESTNKDIFLTPSSDFGGSKGRLIQFYKGFGFKPNSGKHRDFRSRNTMVLHTEGKLGGMITESGSLPGVIPIPANLADPIIKDFIKNIVIPSKAVDPDTITGLGSTRQILKNLPGAKKIAGDLDLVAVATVDRKSSISDLTSKAKSMGLDYQIAFGNVFSVGYPFKGNKYQVDLMVSEASDDNSVYNYMVKFRYWSDESGEQNTPFTLKGAHRSELTRTIIKAVGLSATERGFSEFKWNDKYDTVDKLSDELNKKADKFRDETKKRETKEVASLIKTRLGDIKRLRNLLADKDGIIVNRYPHSLFKNLPLGYDVLTDILFDKIEGRDNWEKLLDKKFGITNTLERMRKFDDVVDLIKELLKKKVLTPTSVVYAFREMKKNFNTGKAAGNWNSDLENYIEKSFGFLKNRW